MKLFRLLVFSFALFSVSILAQNYKQVKIHINDLKTDIELLRKFDIPIDEMMLSKESDLVIFLSDDDFARLSLLNLQVEVLIDDWFKFFNDRPQMTESEKAQILTQSKELYGVSGLSFGSMSGHCTNDEVIQKLDSMRLQFPTLISAKMNIGFTVQNRAMYAVRISNNPDITQNKPRVLYTALTHAREPAGMMTILYYMYYLLENYNTNPSVKYLVDTREMYFIPVINVDGYEYNRSTNPTGGGMWRKNRKATTASPQGVDLNRNFGPMAYWNSPNGGSSTTPSAEDYRGEAPFSEMETQNMKNFVAGKAFKTNLNYHTYANIIIYPYGALDRETADSLIFREMGSTMSAFNGYTMGTALQLLYAVRGGSDDYYYDGDTLANGGRTFALTPEVGGDADGFWAPQNRIFPIAQENLGPNLYMAWVAGDYVKYSSVTYNKQYFNLGDSVQMSVKFKNSGLSTAKSLNIQLTSLSPNLVITAGSVLIDSIKSRQEFTAPQPFRFNVLNTAPVGEYLKMVISTRTSGILMSTDTVKIIAGIPTFMFIDTTNNINSKWTIVATPTTPKWDVTTTDFHTAPNSYTDSPVGNYVSNASVDLTTTNAIDLTGVANPKLSFWTKWSIEKKWDCGIVQLSTDNGSTWVAVTGAYTVPASGSGKQVPAGMPIYDNTQNTWVQENVFLPGASGKQIKLRFRLLTDGSINQDGWYLDDIGVYVFAAVPVELNSFSAKTADSKVELTWLTATELNNKGFSIERSENKISWRPLGFVDGNGTTNEKKNYKFTDSDPISGKSYYRLKQFDFEGTYRIYGPVEVETSPVYSYSLEQNFPNPFNPTTKLNYSIAKAGNVSLKVFDINGRAIATLFEGNREAGKFTAEFDATGFSSGVYFYELRSGEFTQRLKMLLLK